MDFIDVTIRESVYLKHEMTEEKAIQFINKYVQLMSFEEVKYLELCFLDNTTNGALQYDEHFIRSAYEAIDGKYGLSAVLHPELVDIRKWNPEVIRLFSVVRFMINTPMDRHCEEIIDYLHSLGVSVSINVIYISKKNDEFIKACYELAEKKHVEEFTFADSCGSLMPHDVERLLDFVRTLDTSHSMTHNFHFHDHSGLALANALNCILAKKVDLMDCSIHGYGKGGGNLNMELIITTLRKAEHIELPVQSLIHYGLLLKYLTEEIFEEDPSDALEFYKNLIIGIYGLTLAEIGQFEKMSAGSIDTFIKLAAMKGHGEAC